MFFRILMCKIRKFKKKLKSWKATGFPKELSCPLARAGRSRKFLTPSFDTRTHFLVPSCFILRRLTENCAILSFPFLNPFWFDRWRNIYLNKSRRKTKSYSRTRKLFINFYLQHNLFIFELKLGANSLNKIEETREKFEVKQNYIWKIRNSMFDEK